MPVHELSMLGVSIKQGVSNAPLARIDKQREKDTTPKTHLTTIVGGDSGIA